ncbi:MULTISPECIES: type I pullulanase [Bacillus]|uniref:Pullulanase n=2 Tax=Bacillus TaxID=1386 RepID=A0A0M3R9U9_9BACI|nr:MULTISPECIES: type I pullulanase [Bacillus]ALC82056.1 pullulanase [Bacillus gobiensis]MBP1083403.1 pullulanase [Bacillus capparidis]MED1097835.1 type I pullulanase [Bacillus capparidis]
MVSVKREFEAYLDQLDVITILVPEKQRNTYTPPFYIGKDPNSQLKELSVVSSESIGTHVKYIVKVGAPLTLGATYYLFSSSKQRTDLQTGAVIRTKEFDEAYYYEEKLGCIYHASKSIFRLWAPTATASKVRLKNTATEEEFIFPMIRKDRGVFEAVVSRNIEGWEYLYEVCVNLQWNLTVDPYAEAVTANGKEGIVIDPQKTAVTRHNPVILKHPTDAIIYETHIRDFSIHPNSGISNNGKYLAFTEYETTNNEGYSTGVAYVKEIGVTHIELLPFNDFGGVDENNPSESYNWGYNPIHFNAPEGSYATNPEDPYNRIIELKKAIQALHKKGLGVIMDVVYNHVYDHLKSPFELTVPGYYFRYDENGTPSNGTGVGNDIASERLMARRYIIDSIEHWVKEYDVDGLRFDLMGILDIETMMQIKKRLNEVKPGMLIFGEGWNLATPLADHEKAIITNSHKLEGIGFFNDKFRDSVKGSTFSLQDRGFALGNSRKIDPLKQEIAGKGIPSTQSVNYVESHDNHTFWDKMAKACSEENDQTKRLRQRLALSIVLLSPGIPFIHSGQEFYRTKFGHENSYCAGDGVNQIDWDKRAAFHEDISYFKKMAALRKQHPAFRFHSSLESNHLEFFGENTPGLIAYRLHSLETIDEWKEIIVIHHNQREREIVSLPSNKRYTLVCDPYSFDLGETTVTHSLEISEIGTYVLYHT